MADNYQLQLKRGTITISEVTIQGSSMYNAEIEIDSSRKVLCPFTIDFANDSTSSNWSGLRVERIGNSGNSLTANIYNSSTSSAKTNIRFQYLYV